MRFASKAWLLAVATVASVSIPLLVQGFQLSSTPRGFSICRSSIQASSATTLTETDSAVATAPRHDMSYAEVNHLAFRALQRECKALGLSAVGTTAALRGRLLEHFGLMGKESSGVGAGSQVAAPVEAEVEVSSILSWIECAVRVV